MATNISKLKSSKGTPPRAEDAPDVMAINARKDGHTKTTAEAVEAMRPLQVRVPESVFAEFSEQAGREYGFTHGSKKQLFLKMWEFYKTQNMKS